MRVLITGGTGLVGKALTGALTKRGDEVVILSRHAHESLGNVQYKIWNVRRSQMDSGAFKDVDAIVNLAGSPIGQKWTSRGKKAIYNSRIDSTQLLVNEMISHGFTGPLISASAMGLYASTDQVVKEDGPHGSGFLAQVVRHWESASNHAASSNRVVNLRIGMVLSADGGVLGALTPLFKRGLGSIPGTGDEWISWVHIDDLVSLILFAIEEESMNGAFNATSPEPVQSNIFYKTLAQSLGSKLWLPRVPAFVLRRVMGERSSIILDSHRLSASQTVSAGFSFQFQSIKMAFNNLFDK